METKHRKRVKHYDEPGHAHFLTFSCYHRLPLLSKDRTRMWLINAINHARLMHGFHIWAWVTMPEHVHLLIWPPQPASTAEILRSIKVPVAKRAIAYLRQHSPRFLERLACPTPDGLEYHFWQPGPGFDRNITEPAIVYDRIDYIHHNPVKRGLVAKPGDWIWSSYLDWHGVGKMLIPLNRESLPTINQ